MSPYIILILLAAAMFAAIIYLVVHSHQIKSNEGFVKKMVAFLQGICDAQLIKWTIAEDGHLFSIRFTFEAQEFILGAIEEKSFDKHIEKVYLKTMIPIPFILSFSELEGSMMTRLDMTIISQVDDPSLQKTAVNIPKGLKDLHIFTNDIAQTNKLFNDAKITRILLKFRNVNHRGHPFMALKIIDGIVSLEFYPSYEFVPSLPSLKNNVSLIEDYLVDLMDIVKKFPQPKLSS